MSEPILSTHHLTAGYGDFQVLIAVSLAGVLPVGNLGLIVVMVPVAVVIGWLDSFRAISKEVDITMSVFFSMPEFVMAIEALDAGQYAPQHLISDTIGLGALPQAFEALRQRTTQCKVLVDPFA